MTIQDWLGEKNTLGIDVHNGKYIHENETFDHWLDRVSGGNAILKKLIIEKKVLPAGRILAGRGLHDIKTTYSNCYCLAAPKDNLESIFDTAKQLARTFSYGGGVGIDIGNLAPNGARVRNAAKYSSGAVSFMDLYSMVTGLIAQAGRRGALMLSMPCDHPDIEEFIDIKTDLNKVTKANISVRVTEKFMKAAEENCDFMCKFIREETGEEIHKLVNARDLLMKLSYNNWDMGEPGILFWDRIENWNLVSDYPNFKYAGVNPCAEEPLPAYGSCLLSSMNLAAFVYDRDGKCDFNFDEFGDAVYNATIALNEILDEGLPLHPLKEQQECVRDWRQIGLGVMGVADMLIKMKIRYGSPESLKLCEKIADHMLNSALLASSMLAKNNGHPFPKYNYESLAKSKFYQNNVWRSVKSMIEVYGLYNSQLLTIAPTGTLSTMLGISGGIEPIFANSYTRRTESLHGKEEYYKVYTPIVQEYMDKHGITDEADLPDYFVTAKEIPYEERIAMQSVWQKYIDASISSTINLPYDSTPEDVFNIYMAAFKAGLKGITVFRDGCRRTSVLSTGDNKSTNDTSIENESSLPRGYIVSTSDKLVGKKRKLTTGCGSLHCAAFFDPNTGDLMETYLSKGSTGGCQNFMIGLSRMISLAARAGCSIDNIIDQLDSCGVCPSYAVRKATKNDTSRGSCCPIAVGNALRDMWEEMQKELNPKDESNAVPETNVQHEDMTEKDIKPSALACPECNEILVHEGGCDICKACGWSKCG